MYFLLTPTSMTLDYLELL